MARWERAIVMGGSMAGLLAARVLADHATEVVVLERDELPGAPGHRKGVPQSRHTHVLLGAGRRTLEQLFPGLTDDAMGRGAVQGDALKDVRRYIGGGYHASAPSAMRTLYISRPLLESLVRERVRSLPNVRVMERADVRGVAWSPDQGRVTGVTVDHEGTHDTIAADLVVDATGRGSRSPQWLQQAGYEAPDEELVECNAAYATQLFRAAPGQLRGLRAVVVPMAPGRLRGAVLARQEDETWTLSLMGLRGDRPPIDTAGFRAFARSLPASEIAELAESAEPIGDPVPAAFPSNVRRRYDLLERFPDGYLVVGDAICSFNPMYGQGMSVAALELAALAETLAEPAAEQVGPRFFRRAAPVLEAPWLLAAGNDLRLTRPDAPVEGRTRFVRWYMDRLHVAARTDVAVAQAFLLVAGLVAPPASLMKPAIMVRVLGATLAGRAA
ncbi:MAG: FAD-dependent monooxygenase [Gemmatimonadales bacterium]|jgi:2-polyprenyl-6-methoxyphenol hydroxylase-like FAD-dependent oxidoreductase|nr:FAD-dependent monooxygenase [Gemmatimonadales bacterium]